MKIGTLTIDGWVCTLWYSSPGSVLVLSAKLLLTKHIFCVTSVTRRLLDTTTSGTARRRLGGAPARPNPSSQYEI